MKKNYFLLFFVFLSTFSYGQDYQRIDSLKTVHKKLSALSGTENDTLLFKAAIEIGNLYSTAYSDTAMLWYLMYTDTLVGHESVLLHPRRADYNAEALLLAGSVANNTGDYSTATRFFVKSLEIFSQTQNHKGISRNLMSLGNSAFYVGNYSRAIRYYSEAIEIAKKTGNKKVMSDCFSNIGVAYSDQGDYSKSLEYYDKALTIRTEINDKHGIAMSYINQIGRASCRERV